jgi:hypothetical protein
VADSVRILYRPIGQVGARVHTEHWIPAEDLAELNRNLVGTIEVIASFE